MYVCEEVSITIAHGLSVYGHNFDKPNVIDNNSKEFNYIILYCLYVENVGRYKYTCFDYTARSTRRRLLPVLRQEKKKHFRQFKIPYVCVNWLLELNKINMNVCIGAYI